MEELKEIATALENYIKLLGKEKYTKTKKENIEFQKERLNKIREDIKNNNF